MESCLVHNPEQRIDNIQEVRRHLGRQIGSTFFQVQEVPQIEFRLPAPLTRFIGRENELTALETRSFGMPDPGRPSDVRAPKSNWLQWSLNPQVSKRTIGLLEPLENTTHLNLGDEAGMWDARWGAAPYHLTTRETDEHA